MKKFLINLYDTVIPAVSFTASILYHKFFIVLYGRKVGLSWKRLLVHDWSKFRPSIFPYYAMHFGSRKGLLLGNYNTVRIQEDFDGAWHLHSMLEPHHLKYHEVRDQKMPFCDRLELYCDWCAASRVYGGKKPPVDITDWAWYINNNDRFKASDALLGVDIDAEAAGVLRKID